MYQTLSYFTGRVKGNAYISFDFFPLISNFLFFPFHSFPPTTPNRSIIYAGRGPYTARQCHHKKKGYMKPSKVMRRPICQRQIRQPPACIILLSCLPAVPAPS